MNLWKAYDDGNTIEEAGVDGGTIIKDEQYRQRCRITIEKNSIMGAYSITCGIYGLMVHSVSCCSKENAFEQFEQMKKEAADFIDSDNKNENWCTCFVNKFPI